MSAHVCRPIIWTHGVATRTSTHIHSALGLHWSATACVSQSKGLQTAKQAPRGLSHSWGDFTPIKSSDHPRIRGGEGRILFFSFCPAIFVGDTKAFPKGFISPMCPKVWAKCSPFIWFYFFSFKEAKGFQLPTRKVSPCFKKTDWMNSNVAL